LIRSLLIVLLAFLARIPVFAQESGDGMRPATQDIFEYKDAYVPEKFHFESFNWEIADVVVLAVMLAAAGLLSVRHSAKRRFTALPLAGLVYFGLLRGGCICPVGSTTNFCLGLAAPELIGKIVAFLFLLPLVAAFFFGRVFCTSACPLGAIQHLLSRKKVYPIPRKILRVLHLVPFLMLAFTVWAALRGGIFLPCRLDVYKPVFFAGHAGISQLANLAQGTATESGIILAGSLAAWSLLAGSLALGYFVQRPFCRFVCPYGVLLGIFARIGLRQRSIDPDNCFACGKCAKTCPVQAITADPANRTVKISNFHCIQCGRCDEICPLPPSPRRRPARNY
jgi:polyferredoxin